MTLRPSPASSSSVHPVSALDYEIAQEQVSALGRLGRALEAALAALSEYERTHSGRDKERAALIQKASEALWCFIVQREAIGLRDARPVMRDYLVPTEVHNRIGVFGRPSPNSNGGRTSEVAPLERGDGGNARLQQFINHTHPLQPPRAHVLFTVRTAFWSLNQWRGGGRA